MPVCQMKSTIDCLDWEIGGGDRFGCDDPISMFNVVGWYVHDGSAVDCWSVRRLSAGMMQVMLDPLELRVRVGWVILDMIGWICALSRLSCLSGSLRV